MTNPHWPPFDLERLDPEEREIWDKWIEGNTESSKDGPHVRVYGFGHICMLELGRIPEVVHEFIDNGRIAEALTQYQANMREKRRREREAEAEGEG